MFRPIALLSVWAAPELTGAAITAASLATWPERARTPLVSVSVSVSVWVEVDPPSPVVATEVSLPVEDSPVAPDLLPATSAVALTTLPAIAKHKPWNAMPAASSATSLEIVPPPMAALWTLRVRPATSVVRPAIFPATAPRRLPTTRFPLKSRLPLLPQLFPLWHKQHHFAQYLSLGNPHELAWGFGFLRWPPTTSYTWLDCSGSNSAVWGAFPISWLSCTMDAFVHDNAWLTRIRLIPWENYFLHSVGMGSLTHWLLPTFGLQRFCSLCHYQICDLFRCRTAISKKRISPTTDTRAFYSPPAQHPFLVHLRPLVSSPFWFSFSAFCYPSKARFLRCSWFRSLGTPCDQLRPWHPSGHVFHEFSITTGYPSTFGSTDENM